MVRNTSTYDVMCRSLCLIFFLLSCQLHAEDLKPIVLDPSYNHTKWGPGSTGILREFRAYTSSFDDGDDDDGFGGADSFGVPEWVAYEIKRTESECIETGERPSEWISDDALVESGLSPEDDTYKYSREFRNKHKSWFVRGHLCMKLHAERLGSDAAWNTHTMFNAVPQRQDFNGGIWLDMEYLTSAWAQRFGSVWVITGPIFGDNHAYGFIGEPEKDEMLVAIPEALFKIVIKESSGGIPEVLAFIYPQIGPGYDEDPFDHSRFLTTVSEIEKRTNLSFFNSLSASQRELIRSSQTSDLWPVEAGDFIEACN